MHFACRASSKRCGARGTRGRTSRVLDLAAGPRVAAAIASRSECRSTRTTSRTYRGDDAKRASRFFFAMALGRSRRNREIPPQDAFGWKAFENCCLSRLFSRFAASFLGARSERSVVAVAHAAPPLEDERRSGARHSRARRGDARCSLLSLRVTASRGALLARSVAGTASRLANRGRATRSRAGTRRIVFAASAPASERGASYIVARSIAGGESGGEARAPSDRTRYELLSWHLARPRRRRPKARFNETRRRLSSRAPRVLRFRDRRRVANVVASAASNRTW